MGDHKHFQPASGINPAGFWELQDMQRLHTQTLSRFGMDYFRIKQLPDNWHELPWRGAAIESMRNLLKRNFADVGKWGWKEPTTAILLPLYKVAFSGLQVTGPRYVISVRHPLSVSASHQARVARQPGKDDDTPIEFSASAQVRMMGLWVHYILGSLYHSIGSRRRVVLYENLIEKPESELLALCKFFGLSTDEAGLKEAVRNVRPELSHSSYSVYDLAALPAIVQRTYGLCLRASGDPEGFTSGLFDEEITSLWRRWSVANDLILPIPNPPAAVYVSGGNDEGGWRISEPYGVTGDWQTVQVKIKATRGSLIRLDLYQAPSQLWIRKAVWRLGNEEITAGLRSSATGQLEQRETLRLMVFGEWPLLTQMPSNADEATLELEFLVDSDEPALREVVQALSRRATVSRPGGLATLARA